MSDPVSMRTLGRSSALAPATPSLPPLLPVEPASGSHGTRRALDPRGAARRHWQLIVASTLVTAAAAAFVTSRMPRTYESTASIRIDERRRTMLPLEAMRELGEGGEVIAEMAEIGSRSLAEDVADTLGLRVTLVEPANVAREDVLHDVRAGRGADSARYAGTRLDDSSVFLVNRVKGDSIIARPGSRVQLGDVSFTVDGARAPAHFEVAVSSFADAVDALRKHTRVARPSREAGVVTITYRGNEPALVRDIPNVLATQFIERRLAAQQAETRSTAHFLRDQIEKLNGQLASAEEALRAFRERARIVNIGEQGRSETADEGGSAHGLGGSRCRPPGGVRGGGRVCGRPVV